MLNCSVLSRNKAGHRWCDLNAGSMQGLCCWGGLRWRGQVLWQARANSTACCLCMHIIGSRWKIAHSGIVSGMSMCMHKQRNGKRGCFIYLFIFLLGTTVPPSHTHSPTTWLHTVLLQRQTDNAYFLCASIIDWRIICQWGQACTRKHHVSMHLSSALVLWFPPSQADHR